MTHNRRSDAAQPYDFKSWRDITPRQVSVGTMLHNKTGTWRFIKPMYEDKTPACRNGCPAGNDIEGWLKLLEKKEFQQAYWHLKREEPFPAVLGRVCFKFCEGACNRSALDARVGIRELERFIGDQVHPGTPHPDLPAMNGKSLAVVGSGPAGMSVAYFARLLGFKVTIFEKTSEPGGILRWGIPAYRLPRKIVAAEFQALADMGIELKSSVEVGTDISLDALASGSDYIFFGIGAHRSLALPLKGTENCEHVMSGLSFLKTAARCGCATTENSSAAGPDQKRASQVEDNGGHKIGPGRKVMIVGGGNTALDAARTAIRMDKEVTVVYRRSREEMPAHPEEVREAMEEGVVFRFHLNPEAVILNGDNTIKHVLCREMTPGTVDNSGRCRPIPTEGEPLTIKADTLITAIGEVADFTCLRPWDASDSGNGELKISPDSGAFSADAPDSRGRLYAGGDMTDASRTVVHAVASGKKAAIAMDCHRLDKDFHRTLSEIKIGTGDAVSFSKYMGWAPVNPVNRNDREVVEADSMVFDYFEIVPAEPVTIKSGSRRKISFDPYRETMSETTALAEAARCMHCGRCTACDNCLVLCPDISILCKGDGAFGYDIDYDYCKGCGICAMECPRNAITMCSESAPAHEETLSADRASLWNRKTVYPSKAAGEEA